MAVNKLRYVAELDSKKFKSGANVIKGAVAAIGAALVAATKIAADFEVKLSKLEAVSGATADEMERLEQKARQLGATTAYTASEAATLQFELAKLGFTVEEIITSSGGILDLASALGVELGDAAVLAGSTVRAFGLDIEETGRVVDVLARATSSSALDFSKLTESLKTAAPIAKLYNFTIEETVGMLGALANAGIHGSQAGVALRQIFLELDKKGIKFADALQMVNDSANPAATAMELVGKRAAGAFAIIANDQKTVQDLTDKLENANGAAQDMRETMEDNLTGDFAKFKSAVSEAAIEIGQSLTPYLRQLVQFMTKIVNSGILVDIWDNIRILVGDVALGILQVGRAIDFAALAVSKGPFGTGDMLGNSEILQRILKADKAIDDLTKKLDYLRKKDNGIDIGLPGLEGNPNTNNTGGNNTVGSGSGSSGTSGSGSSGSGIGEGGPGVYTYGWIGDEASKFKKNADEATETALSLQGVFNSLANSISEAFSGEITGKGLLASVLSVLGDVAIQVGIASLTIGTTIEAIRTALMSFFGVGAIAAGAILIGTGIALKAGAAALGKAKRSANVPSSATGGSSSSSPASSLTQTQGSDQDFRLVTEVSGQHLRLVMQRADDSYSGLS